MTLVALVAVLAGVLAWQFWPAASPSVAAVPAARANPKEGAEGIDPRTLDVRLAGLEREGAAPKLSGRDPFAFRAVPPPPPPQPPGGPARPPGSATSVPVEGGGAPPPPPPPPIVLKFIGLVVEGPGQRKIAVLSDGKFVFHGREGDIIEGRFRVVRIGDESIQMEHIDGRGRQTIRLSGS